jgi:F0F1-type ATP synthase assembly protein I
MSSSQPPTGDSSDKRRKKLEEEYLDRGERDQSLQQLATAGLELGAIVLIFVALGWWLDTKFDTSPWMLLGLALLGILSGMTRLFLRVKRLSDR